MAEPGRFAVLAALAVAGCGPQVPENPSEESIGPTEMGGSGKWVAIDRCYWRLDNEPSALSAWVLGDIDGGTGVALAFSDRNKFPDVPTSDRPITITFVPNGAVDRGIESLGWHPAGQGAYMISGEFGPRQQEALVGAKTIALYVDGKKASEVTAQGFPTLEDLASCES